MGVVRHSNCKKQVIALVNLRLPHDSIVADILRCKGRFVNNLVG